MSLVRLAQRSTCGPKRVKQIVTSGPSATSGTSATSGPMLVSVG